VCFLCIKKPEKKGGHGWCIMKIALFLPSLRGGGAEWALGYEHTVNKIKNIISDYRKRAEETPLLFEKLLNKSDSV